MKSSLTIKFLMLSLALSLSACGYSVEQLVRNDDLRHKVLKECVVMGKKAVDADKCKKATEAQARVTGNAIKNIFE
ncbi:MAG: EexN family lipoprotein [Gammaproteobacteria bacterium]|nr:EexN family lipoprotein [Gammaproteobacteria bacterium]